MHIPRSKIGELAHQAESVGIFAIGEYLGGGIPLGMPFFFLWRSIRFELSSASACFATRFKLVIFVPLIFNFHYLLLVRQYSAKAECTYPARRSGSLLTRRRVRVSSPQANTWVARYPSRDAVPKLYKRKNESSFPELSFLYFSNVTYSKNIINRNVIKRRQLY